MLADLSLTEPAGSFTLTYVEVASLPRQAFLNLLQEHGETCPALVKKVRWFVCWLAFQRALMQEAHQRLGRLSSVEPLALQDQDKFPMPSPMVEVNSIAPTSQPRAVSPIVSSPAGMPDSTTATSRLQTERSIA